MTNDEIQQHLAAATPEAAAALRDAAEAADNKAERKAALRALYLLSQKGIVPPEREAAPKSSGAVGKSGVRIRAFASAYDGAGNRLMLFVLPDPDGGSPDVVQILTNDIVGVQNFGVRRVSRREVRELLTGIEAQLEEGLAMAEITLDYGLSLLHQARDTTRRIARPTPAGFLDALERMGTPEENYTDSSVYACISAEAVRADETLSRDPAELFRLSWFEPWFFTVEEAAPWLYRVAEAGESQLALPEAEKTARRERALSEAVENLMTPELRERYARRLEETADVLARRGQEVASRTALFHAVALREETPIAEVPFARVLVERSLAVALEMLRAEREGAGGDSAVGGGEV